MRHYSRVAAVLLSLLGTVVLFAQAKIEGQVVDGTSRRPLPNQELRLLLPKGGMQEVANTHTDASGRFSFEPSGIEPNSFYLVEARFQDVAYHAPAQFDSNGIANVNLTVYESARSPVALRVQSLRALVRINGAKAQIQEEYDVLNSSDPPRAYVSDTDTFRFYLSPGAGEPTVAVAALMNMMLPQPPQPGNSRGEFYIRYPFKPGLTRVGLTYDADYTSSHLALSDQVSYPIDQAQIYVVPSTLSANSPLFNTPGLDSVHTVM